MKAGCIHFEDLLLKSLISLLLFQIIGWKPDFYNVTELPEDMPEDLVEYVKNESPSEVRHVRWVYKACYSYYS